MLNPGQIFAQRYRVVKFLAQGGMGAVFVAEHMGTEKPCAIKVLFPNVLASRDGVERFQLEARVAARAGSEHIVQVLDAGLDEETQMPFLVMELLVGKNLDDLVVEQGPLPPERVVHYLAQAAAGLDRAHGYRDKDGSMRPIVHRDLKPENLFLTTREDGSPLVKILDFGLAKVLSDSTKMSQDMKGTPLYMAIEQATGAAVSPKTDLWAFGLIAFYLLTGKHYWRAANQADAGIQVLFGEIFALPIDPPSMRSREYGAVPLPASFDAWFGRLVVREVETRYSSAGEACAALAQAFGLQASMSTSTGMPALAAQLAAPAPAHVAPGPPPAQAMTAAGAAMDIHQSTVTPQKKGSGPLIAAAVVGALVVAGGGTALMLARGSGQPSAPDTAAAKGATPSADPPKPAIDPAAVVTAAPVVSAAPAPSAAAPVPATSAAKGPAVKAGPAAGPKPPKPPGGGGVYDER